MNHEKYIKESYQLNSIFNKKDNIFPRIDSFDSQKIYITKKNIALDVIVRRLKEKTIRLTPDFQYNKVWDHIQRSRFLESIILNIPLPIFYVSADKDGNWDIIDGSQRLATLKEFILDKSCNFKGLEYYQNYNGKTIDDLSPVIYNAILDTELTFIIIEPNTPKILEYNILQRINTYKNRLTSQEIRNILYFGEGTKFIKYLASSDCFIKSEIYSRKVNQHINEEKVFRLISFLLVDKDGFFEKDNLDSFLIRTLKILNSLNKNKYEFDYIKILVNNFNELENLFIFGIERIEEFFDYKALKILTNDYRNNSIKTAYYETFATLLARLSDTQFSIFLKQKNLFIKKYENLCISNEFYKAILQNPYKKKNLDYRFHILNNLIYEAIK